MNLQAIGSLNRLQFVFCWLFLTSIHTVNSLQDSSQDWEQSEKQYGEPLPNDEPTSQLNIELIYGITADRKALITCEVNMLDEPSPETEQSRTTTDAMSMSTVYLLCPQISTSICYMDCTPNCVLGDRGCTVPHSISQVIQRCEYRRINATRLEVDYEIDLEALNQTGKWNCAYRGQHASRPLELRSVERRPGTVTRSSHVDRIAESTKTPAQSQIPAGNYKASAEHTVNRKMTDEVRQNQSTKAIEWMSNPQQSNSVRTRVFSETANFKLTRPELVVILLVVLSISLIFNVILSVRCALTKTYLDKLSRGKADSALARLLCFRQKPKVNQLFCNPTGQLLFTRNAPVTNETTNVSSIHNSASLDETAIDNLMFYTTQRLSPVSDGTGIMLPSRLYRSIYAQSPSRVPTPINLGEWKKQVMMNGLCPPVQNIAYGQQTTVSLAHPSLIGDGYGFSEANGIGVTSDPAQNGSMTGSVILTNDSARFTEGLSNSFVVGHRPMHQRVSPPQFNENHSGDAHQNFTEDPNHSSPSRKNLISSSAQQQQRELNKLPLPPLQVIDRSQTCSESPESYDYGQTGHSLAMRSEMTPLVVRFPSGESGLLICPGNTDEEAFGTRSLPKPLRVRRSTSNCSRFTSTRRTQRHQTTSTLLTTDTDSEPGYVEIVRNGQNHRSEFVTNPAGDKQDEYRIPVKEAIEYSNPQKFEDQQQSSKDSIISIDRSNSEVDSIGQPPKAEAPGYKFLPSHPPSSGHPVQLKGDSSSFMELLSNPFTAFKPAIPRNSVNGMVRPDHSFNKPSMQNSRPL